MPIEPAHGIPVEAPLRASLSHWRYRSRWATTVFPTPLYDTRELIAWGRQFAWVTPVHPPMMAWIGGAVDWLAGPSAAAMILTGQLLLTVGLAYLLRDPAAGDGAGQRGPVHVVDFGISLYTVFAPLSRLALTADILQPTPWPAIVLWPARRPHRSATHWIALGVWSAIGACSPSTTPPCCSWGWP